MSIGTILIMAGGTGGHIMPGLAVADVLRARGWQVIWLGHPEKMEGKWIPTRGYHLIACHFQGVRGRGLSALLKLPFLLLKALKQAWIGFREIKPNVVLGMGGYAAFPGALIARCRDVPLIVHEQNAVPGTTNRILARFAARVLTGFPSHLPKAQLVGNPVRQSIRLLPHPDYRYAMRSGALQLLVVGGSLGASILNKVVPQALALLSPEQRPNVIHQTGEHHIAAVQSDYADYGISAECHGLIHDMATAFSRADLVICRAGAMTVAEVSAAGVAALFVPYPYAIDDHQTANACYLSKAQAAWLQPQQNFTVEWLMNWLSQRHRAELQAVANHARTYAWPHAAEDIANVCEKIALRKQSKRIYET